MKKALRVIGVIVVIILIGAAIFTSINAKPSNAELVWDEKMTVGNPDAKNYFIIYSDLLCPYCIAFENAIIENEEAFQEYIKENDILVEVRLSDFLYEYGETNPINSRYAAVASYCAKNEDKFWDYYNKAVTSVWNDFFKSEGKSAFNMVSKLDKKYWTDIGKKVGLGDTFEECVKNDTPLPEIEANAERTSKLAQGMPYFKFNNYINSGFSLSWGYDYVLKYFQAGLDS